MGLAGIVSIAGVLGSRDKNSARGRGGDREQIIAAGVVVLMQPFFLTCIPGRRDPPGGTTCSPLSLKVRE